MKANRLVLILFLLTSSSCRYSDDRLKVKNTRGYEIAVEFSEDTIPVGNNRAEFFLSEKILPGDTKQIDNHGLKNEWSRFIQRSENKKLNIFVYRVDTIEKYMDMDVLRAKMLYDKRVSFSESELNEMRWMVLL